MGVGREEQYEERWKDNSKGTKKFCKLSQNCLEWSWMLWRYIVQGYIWILILTLTSRFYSLHGPSRNGVEEEQFGFSQGRGWGRGLLASHPGARNAKCATMCGVSSHSGKKV